MPIEAFEVIVGADGDLSKEQAIADASRYLAYCDQTDSFGYSANILDVETHGGFGNGDWGIAFTFSHHVTDDLEREKFYSEMKALSRVEVYEQIPFEPA